MCFSYTRNRWLSIQPNFRRSDGTSSTITEFEASMGDCHRSCNQQMRNRPRGGPSLSLGVMGAVIHGSSETVAIFGSNGFSWNYFSTDAGVPGPSVPSANSESRVWRWEWGFRPNLEILGIAFTMDG